ncbi:acyltransferase family protein [Bacteroides sp. 44_46]|uniref:acyltransferase family protein n=1 Tax=Bacteroides sp. 44_46 TaxID=1897052 RepID=UPI00095DC240|nr:MAG: hypothetical protein BHV73_13340 [Bacteroides sp. 44_46]
MPKDNTIIIQKNKRNEVFDLARGIAIILVVIGHSGCPEYLRNFIYLFHMPVFYTFSGYFFNSKKNIQVFSFIKRKIDSLYKPFVIYSFVFLLFTNIFYKSHIISKSISLEDFQKLGIHILIFKNSIPLLPFWFLRSLFIINVIFLFEYTFMLRRKYDARILMIINLILFFIGSYFCMNGTHLPLELQREFILLLFFTFGFYLKMIPSILKIDNNLYLIIRILILLVCPFFAKIDLAYSIIFNPIVLIVCSFCGITLLLDFCNFLKQCKQLVITKKILCLCGKHSLAIFALHFISFKIVSQIIINIKHLDINLLTSFPTIKDISPYWWIFYTIIGVLTPLALNILYTRINNFKKQR